MFIAPDGKKGMERQRTEGETNISFVIVDLIIPEMRGKQYLEKLPKVDPGLRVVIANDYSADSQTKEGTG